MEISDEDAFALSNRLKVSQRPPWAVVKALVDFTAGTEPDAVDAAMSWDDEGVTWRAVALMPSSLAFVEASAGTQWKHGYGPAKKIDAAVWPLNRLQSIELVELVESSGVISNVGSWGSEHELVFADKRVRLPLFPFSHDVDQDVGRAGDFLRQVLQRL